MLLTLRFHVGILVLGVSPSCSNTRTHTCRTLDSFLPHRSANKHNTLAFARTHSHCISLYGTDRYKHTHTQAVELVNAEIRNVALRRCHRGLSSLADHSLLSIHIYMCKVCCTMMPCMHTQAHRQIHTHSQLRFKTLNAYVYDPFGALFYCYCYCCCCYADHFRLNICL